MQASRDHDAIFHLAANPEARWGLERTRLGKLLHAVIYDREMAVACGIDVARLFTVTFVIGAILGALGGAITAPQLVPEQYVLDLEREAFVSLCGERKTQERIAHTLKTGKPLRN